MKIEEEMFSNIKLNIKKIYKIEYKQRTVEYPDYVIFLNHCGVFHKKLIETIKIVLISKCLYIVTQIRQKIKK